MKAHDADITKLVAVPSEEWAYIAGFFDGEGYVAVKTYFDKHAGMTVHNAEVRIGQKRRDVLDWISERFPAKIYKTEREGSHIHHLVISGNKSVALFLTLIQKYVIEKKDQVELILQFCKERKELTQEQKDTVVVQLRDMKRSA